MIGPGPGRRRSRPVGVLAFAFVAGLAACAVFVSPSAPAGAASVAPPAAASGWTIYHVYLATFRNGDLGNDGAFAGWRDPLYSGGDLAGLLAALDHLRELGVDALWISPMFAARSSHGYDVTDYTAIGEAVGVAGDRAASLALWRRLRDEAHARGLRIVLDLPLNHASRAYDLAAGDPWRLKPKSTSARQAAEKLWESWNAGYRYWNFDDRGTRDFLKRVALYWLVDEGADGLRLDYVRGVPVDFWQELKAEVDARAPGKLLLGECWADDLGADGNLEEIARYARPKSGAPAFDALLDFPLQETLVEVFAGRAPAARLERVLAREAELWGGGALGARFLDNHDLARFADRAGDPAAVTAALGWIAALPGPIVVFYGTETALGGGPSTHGFTDGGRLPMPWEKLDAARVEATSRILRLRRELPAFARGSRAPLHADDDTVVFARVAPEQVALVGLNVGPKSKVVEVDKTKLPTLSGELTCRAGHFLLGGECRRDQVPLGAAGALDLGARRSPTRAALSAAQPSPLPAPTGRSSSDRGRAPAGCGGAGRSVR